MLIVMIVRAKNVFWRFNMSQTMWINSLVVARQNVPITFIHSETTLS